MSKQRGKNLAVDRGQGLAVGAPSHGTTGSPAQWLIRTWLKATITVFKFQSSD